MLPLPSGGPLAEQVDKLQHVRLTKLKHDSLNLEHDTLTKVVAARWWSRYSGMWTHMQYYY